MKLEDTLDELLNEPDESTEKTVQNSGGMTISAQNVFLGGANSPQFTNNHFVQGQDPGASEDLPDASSRKDGTRIPPRQMSAKDRKAFEAGVWNGRDTRTVDRNTNSYRAEMRKQARVKLHFWEKAVRIIALLVTAGLITGGLVVAELQVFAS